MHKIDRLLVNICSDHLPESKSFYTQLFEFEVGYDSDWFINLLSKDRRLELGIIHRTHDIVPENFQNAPQGFCLTIVVEDVDAVYKAARNRHFEVIQPPEDTFYGQRRLLLKDPDGTLVDVSAPIPGFQFG